MNKHGGRFGKIAGALLMGAVGVHKFGTSAEARLLSVEESVQREEKELQKYQKRLQEVYKRGTPEQKKKLLDLIPNLKPFADIHEGDVREHEAFNKKRAIELLDQFTATHKRLTDRRLDVLKKATEAPGGLETEVFTNFLGDQIRSVEQKGTQEPRLDHVRKLFWEILQRRPEFTQEILKDFFKQPSAAVGSRLTHICELIDELLDRVPPAIRDRAILELEYWTILMQQQQEQIYQPAEGPPNK